MQHPVYANQIPIESEPTLFVGTTVQLRLQICRYVDENWIAPFRSADHS
jgi:hypothetical protein